MKGHTVKHSTSGFKDQGSPIISPKRPRPSRLLLALSVATALFAQAVPSWADTKSDINAALSQLGFASTITTATADQLRQAIARASYTNASSASQVATYVTDVLSQRYPTTNSTSPTQRGTNADVILKGGLQGLRALGDTTAADYDTVTVAAANVSYQPASLDAIRGGLGNTAITQLNTTVQPKFLSGIVGAPTSLTANPDLAGAAAPLVASGLLGTYVSRDVTRDSTITSQVLVAIPAVAGATFTQAERDSSIASVVTTLQGGSYLTAANMNEFVARLAKDDTTTIQTVSQTVAASLADEAAREAFAAGAAGFFTAPNGSTGANQPLIVLPDATKGLLAAGIALAAPGHEGDITSAIAGTMSDSNLTPTQQTSAQKVGNAFALDVRRAVVLGDVVAAVSANAPAITTQYLTDRPITVEANAPAFARTVTKNLPLTVNPANQTAFAGTTASVTAEYVAAAISDTHFNTKAGVARAVVIAVPTFAVETVREVAAQVQSELSALPQASVATAFATAVAANTASSKMTATTQALVAEGVALAFTGNEAKVAQAIADLPSGSSSAAPTNASRAAIAAAVATVVPSATKDIAAQVASSLGTSPTKKAGFGGALIADLPGSATQVTLGLIDPTFSIFADDTAFINFAQSLVGQNATTQGVTASTQVASVVEARLANLQTSAPLLAGAVAGAAQASAASNIAQTVASASGLTIASQAAVAKAVVGAVPGQAQTVALGTLVTSLTIDNGATTPDSVAGTFAAAVPTEAPIIAQGATNFYVGTYLGLHPATTVRAGDIAVSVATSPGVLASSIPAIATEVAQAIFPTNRAAIGGIADKFAAAVGSGTGTIAQSNFNAQAPAIATNLGKVAAPTGQESSELAGIVTALVEALPIATTSNMTLIAKITKNVAKVATTYWASQSVTYKPDDLVGFLVAELLARGASNSVAPGSVLAALKTALTSLGSPITLATVNAVYGNSGTTGTVSINPAYATKIGASGLGTIGDVLSNTTPVTNF